MKKLADNAVLVGYVVFIFSSLFFSLASIPSENIAFSLHELLSGFSLFVFWVVVLAGLVPSFVEHKYASMAYALPLAFLVIGGWSAYSDLSNLMALGRAFGGQAYVDAVMSSIRLGAGFYLGFISAIALAVIGVSRTRKAVAALG